MQYHEFNIPRGLPDYVQSIWAMESENEQDAYPRSLIMPDGIVEVIFYYDSPFLIWQHGACQIHNEKIDSGSRSNNNSSFKQSCSILKLRINRNDPLNKPT